MPKTWRTARRDEFDRDYSTERERWRGREDRMRRSVKNRRERDRREREGEKEVEEGRKERRRNGGLCQQLLA